MSVLALAGISARLTNIQSDLSVVGHKCPIRLALKHVRLAQLGAVKTCPDRDALSNACAEFFGKAIKG